MADSWQVATGGAAPKMDTSETLAAVARILHEFHLEDVSLFDHAPVLRIQVSEAQFTHALDLRETLVERIKPLGYRFIALDLEEL